MSKELEDEFGVRIIDARNMIISVLKETLSGDIGKKASEEQKHVKAFLNTLTARQKEEFLCTFKWGLDGALFSVMRFLTEGDSGVDIKLEVRYKGETELFVDSGNEYNVLLYNLYWDWVEEWGDVL